MTTRKEEISRLVLKTISQENKANEWNIAQHEEKNFVSPRGYVMFYLLYRHQCNTKPFHFHIFFAANGAIYHVAMA